MNTCADSKTLGIHAWTPSRVVFDVVWLLIYCSIAVVRAVRRSVVVPDSAPQTKVDAIKRLGAVVCKVTYDEWWSIIESGKEAPVLSTLIGVGGVFVHPVCDQQVMVRRRTTLRTSFAPCSRPSPIL